MLSLDNALAIGALIVSLIVAWGQMRNARATHRVQESAAIIEGFDSLCTAYRQTIQELTVQIDGMRARLCELEMEREQWRIEREELRTTVARLEAEREELKQELARWCRERSG